VAARNAQRPDWIVTETPETRFLVLEEGRRLDVALRRTSRRARRGLLMAAEGYSGREIAAAIQTNEGATRALMARARKLIRRELGDAPATAA
jgi:DNA-directed RNA polymerase specialized sigma24 family protein